MNKPPGNDAAPLGGEARVNDPNTSPDPTQLFLTPPARDNAPAGTSDVAAVQIAGHARHLRARVLAFIVGQGEYGATDDEGERALGLRARTYTPRRWELVRLGLVVDSGRRRNTATGRPATVWIASKQSPIAEGGAA